MKICQQKTLIKLIWSILDYKIENIINCVHDNIKMNVLKNAIIR